MTKEYITISGNTGKDPASFNTKVGEAVKFSVAQKTGYGDDDRRWYDVAVFNAGLIERVKRELPKGSRVVVEGFAEEREYNGNKSWQIIADKVGLVEWFVATKKGASAPAAAASTGGYSDDV